MGQSIVSKPPRSRRLVKTITGRTDVDSGKIRIDLPLLALTSEYKLDVSVSQTWGTNAPTGSDLRRLFKQVELVSAPHGTLISVDGYQFVDQASFTESGNSPVVALGAGGGAAATARASIDVHNNMDSATVDLLTALQTIEHAELYLELTLEDKDKGMFQGGTGTIGEVVVTINVEAREYRLISGKNIRSGSFIYGKAMHHFRRIESAEGTTTTGVTGLDIKLQQGKKLRHLFLHAYDTTGTIPALANGILDKIESLEIGGIEYYQNIPAEAIQHDNIESRNVNKTGLYVLDFGDQPAGWPMIDGDVRLKFAVRSGAPAGWRIKAAQDSAVDLEKAIAQ